MKFYSYPLSKRLNIYTDNSMEFVLKTQTTSLWPWYVALLLSVTLCFVGVSDRVLCTPDEPRVAAICLEMSKNNNFIVPHLAGVPFVEKPPLYFAVAAASIRTVGLLTGSTAATRLSSAFWGVGIIIMTFLLARLLAGGVNNGFDKSVAHAHRFALMSAVLLATMSTFIKASHWIRVDVALAFFVIAAMWSFGEVYFSRRKKFLFLAAVFSAGAFLSKGTIGPLLIGIGWVGMFLPRMISWMSSNRKEKFIFKYYAASLLLFLILSIAWIAALDIVGGRELFNEWFWKNQIGRFSGTSGLGHVKGFSPFYYVKKLFSNTLPWSPLVLIWLVQVVLDLRKKGLRALSHERIFLLILGFGSLVFLTLAGSKRGLYMLPLLPVFAIMCAEALQMSFQRWSCFYFRLLLFLCIAVLAGLAFMPLLCELIPNGLLSKYVFSPVVWNFWNAVSGLCLVVAAYIFFRIRVNFSYSLIVLAVLAVYICGIKVSLPLYNAQKAMDKEVENFIEQIDPAERPRVASYGLSEDMRGLFYVCDRWKINQLETIEKAKKILSGEDNFFDSLIICTRTKDKRSLLSLLPKDPNCYVVMETTVLKGSHQKRLFWLKSKFKK